MKLMRILLFAMLLFPAILLAQKKETYKVQLVVDDSYAFWDQPQSESSSRIKIQREWNFMEEGCNIFRITAAKGVYPLFFVSRFQDTLRFSLDIQKDTLIYFQNLGFGKMDDFYTDTDSTNPIGISDLKEGDEGAIIMSTGVCYSYKEIIIPYALKDNKIYIRQRANFSKKHQKRCAKIPSDSIRSDFQKLQKELRLPNKYNMYSGYYITIVKNRKITDYRTVNNDLFPLIDIIENMYLRYSGEKPKRQRP